MKINKIIIFLLITPILVISNDQINLKNKYYKGQKKEATKKQKEYAQKIIEMKICIENSKDISELEECNIKMQRFLISVKKMEHNKNKEDEFNYENDL